MPGSAGCHIPTRTPTPRGRGRKPSRVLGSMLFPRYVASCVMVIALRLSQWIGVRSLCLRPISFSKQRQRVHVNCFAAWVSAIYSASVVDKAMVPCFFELHAMQAPSMTHAYPDMDLASVQLAKSVSE